MRRLHRAAIALCVALLSAYFLSVRLPQKIVLEMERSAVQQQRQNHTVHYQEQDDGREHVALRTTGRTIAHRWELGGKYPNQAQLCNDWARAESENKTVTTIIIVGKGTTDMDGLCTPGRAGNMLLALFSVLMMAYGGDVGYELEPHCERVPDGSVGIAAYLPQNISWHHGRMGARSVEERRRDRERMCEHPADALPSREAGEWRWTRYAQLWREELRNALSTWAKEYGKPEIPKGTVSIHVRCGDILSAPLEEASLYGFSTLSFYLRHLTDMDVARIDILTPPLACTDQSRPEDCANGRACARIVHAVQEALVEKLSLAPDAVQIRDDQSELWTMHHMVFSDAIVCTVSSFCGIVSVASDRAVHNAAPWGRAIKDHYEFIVGEGELDNVLVDDSEYLTVAEIRAKNMTTEDIVDHLLNN